MCFQQLPPHTYPVAGIFSGLTVNAKKPIVLRQALQRNQRRLKKAMTTYRQTLKRTMQKVMVQLEYLDRVLFRFLGMVCPALINLSRDFKKN